MKWSSGLRYVVKNCCGAAIARAVPEIHRALQEGEDPGIHAVPCCRNGWAVSRAARLHARVADRRRDWVERTVARIAATYGVVAIEKLSPRNMVRAPKHKPDPDNEGHYLLNGKAAKAGLNKGIYANC